MTRRDRIAVAVVTAGFALLIGSLLAVLIFVIGPGGFIPAAVAMVAGFLVMGGRR